MNGGLREDTYDKNASYKGAESWAANFSDSSQSYLTSSEIVRSNVIATELEQLPEGASLDELISIIGPMTRDRGAVMRAVAAEELDEFAELASETWKAREHGSESTLANQQEHLHRHYSRWSARMEARAEKCRQMLLESCPDFDIQRYNDDPGYMRQLILEKNGEQFDGRVRAWKQNNRDHLAYLRTHIQQLEAEHEELREQLTRLRQKHQSIVQSQAARDRQVIQENENIEKECKLTKAKIAENSKKIDGLLLELEKNEKKSVVRSLDFHGVQFEREK